MKSFTFKSAVSIAGIAVATLCAIPSFAQVKIGDNPDIINPNSLLELESTNKGLLLPRLTTGGRNMMVNPPDGMLIYNSTIGSPEMRVGGKWVSDFSAGLLGGAWATIGNSSTGPSNFLGTTNNASLRLRTSNIQRLIVDSTGSISIGTDVTDATLRLYGQNRSFQWGANQFFATLYSRPSRLNTAASNISYGLLSHSNSDGLGTYNAVAGRILRNADSGLANLTGALGHVNNGGTFQTALLGIVNSRADQTGDNFRYSAAWLRTPNPSALNAAQLASTYTIFAPDTTKSYFEGNIGVGTNAPNSRINIYGNSTAGFAFGANTFFTGLYSRPTRLNAAGPEISYGILSHSKSDATGTYNAVAGRILRNADTGLANLTAALAHVNNPGNFQTAVLGIVNSRADEASDAQIFSAARFTDAAGVLTDAQSASTYAIFASSVRKSYFEGNIGVGTNMPNSRVNIYGNNTAGFAFGANTFFTGLYSRPTRLNAAAPEISYGLLSHTKSDAIGTYNAVAGRVLRNADTGLANLTAALGHVNNPGNFQTAVLGIVNSRADEASDAQVFSAARFTDAAGALSGTQETNTYTIFASSPRKSFFAGNIGVGTNAPNSRVNILGNATAGFAFGANQFFVGLYSRPTRANAVASEISYGLLSHSQSDATGTYNAVAGRILRNADTGLANLTAALGHVNNPGNFQTSVLGIVNSRADQASDAQVFSALRVTDATTGLSADQMANTYSVFAPTATSKSFFGHNVGFGKNAPLTSVDVNGAIAVAPAAATAVSGNALVTVGNRSFLKISSSVLAPNATVTLTNGIADGQILIVKITASGNNGVRFANAGNMSVANAAFTLGNNDVINFIWDASSTTWVETGRSNK
jgi:hypothetical protein